jgi:hypothetical protein
MGVLREIFGPSKNEVWKQLSEEIRADFVEGGFWKGSKVKGQVKQWIVTLDSYAVSTGKTTIVFTRMRAPYVNKDGLRFKIYRRGLLSNLGKIFGMQDIEVGFSDFDDEFIIQGNNPDQIRRLLASPVIRQLIQAQPSITLEVKDDEGWFGESFPEGVDELHFQVVGIIKEIDRLKALYELFGVVLNDLCRIGSAYEDEPGVKLK